MTLYVIEVCKLSLLDTPNQILTSDNVLSDHVFVILEQFCQINYYNQIVWLFLTMMEKVQKQKDEFRASNSLQD